MGSLAETKNFFIFNDRYDLAVTLCFRYYIEPSRGVLNITRCIDRETQSSISVMVYAHDKGVSQRTGSSLVSITITDINDNKPVFSQPQYILSYREGFQGTIPLPEVSYLWYRLGSDDCNLRLFDGNALKCL